jgi:pimeloyl-[acyl-carrier protein] methyl ester esterase
MDLVLVHGWAMNAGIWSPLIPLLKDRFRLTMVDLPGHGASAWNGEGGLSEIAEAVLEVVPPKACWLGWSLGGHVAVRAATLAPRRIARLVLVATSPRFVRGSGWDAGMGRGMLEGFSRDLRADPRATLNRFLALQVRGSEQASKAMRLLKERLLHALPVPEALAAGLAVLRDDDLRAELAGVRCPALFIMGGRDTLVPVAAGRLAAESMTDARLLVMEGAGHAPFLSHPAEFAAIVRAQLPREAGAQTASRHG